MTNVKSTSTQSSRTSISMNTKNLLLLLVK